MITSGGIVSTSPPLSKGVKLPKIILDLCGGTGSWSKPYAEYPHEYDVRNISLPWADVTIYDPPDNVYGILAAPPCTMFSQARRNKKAKPRDIHGAMKVVKACYDIITKCLPTLKFWCLENPATGWLNNREVTKSPKLIFHPYEYGDPWKKKTALWGYFNLPVKTPCLPDIVKPNFTENVFHYLSRVNIPDGYLQTTGYSTQQVLRSMTPSGFARAFFNANR